MKFRGLAFALCVVTLATAPLAAQTNADVTRGRTLASWLLTGVADSLYPKMSPDFQENVGGKDGLIALALQLERNAGKETQVVEEAVYREAGYIDYYREARFANYPGGTITTRIVWRPNGSIIGGYVRPTPPPAATTHEAYETKTLLQLPFNDAFYVAWGGRKSHQNYHIIATDQRFAYDLLIVRGDATHTGDGKSNAQYYCFGQPVLAPGFGRVVVAVDSVRDNTPGATNPQSPPGNHVIIDHGNGEFSLLAHMRRGSIKVKDGQQVAAGDQLGECGNSGNTSEPHIHFHLQTGKAYGEGVGLPAFFNNYVADGKPVARGEPVRGQVIRRPPIR
jgi:hypothetical protein